MIVERIPYIFIAEIPKNIDEPDETIGSDNLMNLSFLFLLS